MKQTIYIASPESKQIHVWKLNVDATLTLVQEIDVPAEVHPMAISPNKQFLYVGVRPDFRIITYRISQYDGSLSLEREFPLPGSPTHISTDYRGFFLFSSSYKSNCVSVIRLEKSIPVETTEVINEVRGCHSANLSPHNQTLWVSALKEDRIYLFTLKKNGKLTLQVSEGLKTANGAGPRHLVFNPRYRYAYVINELHGSVDVWDFNNACGNVRCIQTVNIVPLNFSGVIWAADIHITSNGYHLYTCERSSSTLTILNISEEGKVLEIKGFQKTETQPRAFNIDDSGEFLIVSGQKSNHISLYKINSSNGIPKKIGRYPVGKGPIWIVSNTQN